MALTYFMGIACIIVVNVLFQLRIVESGRVKRVVGGTEVACGTQPRVASLRNSTDHGHLCGATVITADYAITAAHCVHSDKEQYLLQLNNVCVDEGEKPPTAEVVAIISHELYDKYTRAHDIAVLRIVGDFENMDWINETILPRSSFGLSGECSVFGYGVTDIITMDMSEILLAGKLMIISMDECLERVGPFVAPSSDSGMMCAVGDGVDSCQGDSGGPLMCSQTLEGVSSHGLSCGAPGVPALYTSIGAHLPWIRGHIALADMGTIHENRQRA